MRILVSELRPDESTAAGEDIDPAKWDLEIGMMSFPRGLHLTAEAWKTGNDLTVEADVKGVSHFTCSLCLDEFDNLFEKVFTLHYDIKGLDSVTIDPEVREEILMENPIRILCKEDCRGLCLFCGANLNHGPCECERKTKP